MYIGFHIWRQFSRMCIHRISVFLGPSVSVGSSSKYEKYVIRFLSELRNEHPYWSLPSILHRTTSECRGQSVNAGISTQSERPGPSASVEIRNELHYRILSPILRDERRSCRGIVCRWFRSACDAVYLNQVQKSCVTNVVHVVPRQETVNQSIPSTIGIS